MIGNSVTRNKCMTHLKCPSPHISSQLEKKIMAIYFISLFFKQSPCLPLMLTLCVELSQDCPICICDLLKKNNTDSSTWGVNLHHLLLTDMNNWKLTFPGRCEPSSFDPIELSKDLIQQDYISIYQLVLKIRTLSTLYFTVTNTYDVHNWLVIAIVTVWGANMSSFQMETWALEAYDLFLFYP